MITWGENPDKPHYGELLVMNLAFEKERKARAKYVKDHFNKLDGGSWQIEVPRRIKE